MTTNPRNTKDVVDEARESEQGLRERVAELEKLLGEAASDLRAAEAERDRLAEALESMWGDLYLWGQREGPWKTSGEMAKALIETARAALHPQPQREGEKQ